MELNLGGRFWIDYIYYYTLSTAFDPSTLSTDYIDMVHRTSNISHSNALRSPFIGNIRSTRYNGDGSAIIVMDMTLL